MVEISLSDPFQVIINGNKLVSSKSTNVRRSKFQLLRSIVLPTEPSGENTFERGVNF